MQPTPRQQETLRTTVWLVRAVTYLVFAFLVFTEAMLLQGFVLKLLGANPDAAYTQWAYRSLERVMDPFRGIFTAVEIDGNAVLDGSILFAMAIYGIIVLLVHLFLDWLTYQLDTPLLTPPTHRSQPTDLPSPDNNVEPEPGEPRSGSQPLDHVGQPHHRG